MQTSLLGEVSLEFNAVSKVFPGVRALDDVTFSAQAGVVHALMGENGAGKSTLLKALSGFHVPTSGTLRINGVDHVFRDTASSLAAGIAVIYQELSMVPELSVAENLFLGHLPKRRGIIDWPALYREARRVMEPLCGDVDPALPIGRLSIGQQQMVEIAKVLTRGARIIAFDEPTSSLSSREIERLFSVIRRLRDEGRIILYVSHRMDEVFQICDAVTVLKDGRHVKTFPTTKGLTQDVLIKCMVGRDVRDIYRRDSGVLGETVLEVCDVQGPGVSSPLSFSVRAGEVFGFFGLIGAGRTELLKLIFGAARKTGGEIRLKGKPVAIRSPRDAISLGIAFCPENRKIEGIIPLGSVEENINIAARRMFGRAFGILNGAWERANAEKQVKALDIRTPSLAQLVRNLSGGNQQKVILGRWLSGDMSVILFDEPTRGIDVGARAEIYALIRQLAERNVAVVIVSSDLPEVIGVADRIAVMREGGLSGIVDRAEAGEEKLLTLALPQ